MDICRIIVFKNKHSQHNYKDFAFPFYLKDIRGQLKWYSNNYSFLVMNFRGDIKLVRSYEKRKRAAKVLAKKLNCPILYVGKRVMKEDGTYLTFPFREGDI